MTLFETGGLITAGALGAALAWLFRQKTRVELLQVFLSFSGAYLLGVTVTHLLPEVFHGHDATRSSFFILIGFFVQLLIVQLTRGIEHGHLHIHEHKGPGYVVGVYIGLGIHAFLEGIPLADQVVSTHNGEHLYYAVIIHKMPEVFSLATILFFSLKRTSMSVMLLVLFIFISPIGAWVGSLLHEGVDAHDINWLTAIVCGTFIHISTTIIFESSGKAHRIDLMKFGAIVAGVGLALLAILV